MAKTNGFLKYTAAVVALRALFLASLYALRVHVPFMIAKNVFDVYEYIELFRSSMYRPHMKSRPLYYWVIKRLKFVYPHLSVKLMMSLFIFLFDLLAALMLYRVVKTLSKTYKVEDEEDAKILGTTAVFYNYATNPDGYKYFMLVLAVYSSVFSTRSSFGVKKRVSGAKSAKELKGFRFPALVCDLIFVFLVRNTSHVFLSLLFPIIYIRSFQRLKLSDRSLRPSEYLMILREMFVSTTFVLVILKLFRFNFGVCLGLKKVQANLENPYRDLDSHPSIDFSFSWYLDQLFMGSVFTLPLLVGLRRYPFDYLLIMTCLCILRQPQMSVLGIVFMLILLTVNYQLLQRTQPFSKLVHTVLALLIISVFSYASWIGRYMANPNYFFGPQIIILIIFCIILEDYTKVVFFKHNHRVLEPEEDFST